MPLTITVITPPPLGVDDLDGWGTLDGLPYTLDSPVWTTCGEYGLSGSEAARSSDSFEGGRATTETGIEAAGTSGGALAAIRLVPFGGGSVSASGGSLDGGVTVDGSARGGAAAGGTAEGHAEYAGECAAAASASESFDALRVTHLAGGADASCAGAMDSAVTARRWLGDAPKSSGWTGSAGRADGWAPAAGVSSAWRARPAAGGDWKEIKG